VDAAEIERLKALAAQYRADSLKAAKEAETLKARQVEDFIKQLRAEYPKAKPGKASLNLKAELKAKFPGVNFSVRGDRNSITVRYVDGPSKDDVEAVANKYKDGHFNGMEDIHEYDNSAYGKAFDAVCGRVKYMSVDRQYTREAMEAAVSIASERYGEEPLTVKVSEYDGHAYVELDWSREHQHGNIYELLRATDLRF